MRTETLKKTKEEILYYFFWHSQKFSKLRTEIFLKCIGIVLQPITGLHRHFDYKITKISHRLKKLWCDEESNSVCNHNSDYVCTAKKVRTILKKSSYNISSTITLNNCLVPFCRKSSAIVWREGQCLITSWPSVVLNKSAPSSMSAREHTTTITHKNSL